MGLSLVEQREAGWLYAVEFRDFHGEVIHKSLAYYQNRISKRSCGGSK